MGQERVRREEEEVAAYGVSRFFRPHTLIFLAAESKAVEYDSDPSVPC